MKRDAHTGHMCIYRYRWPKTAFTPFIEWLGLEQNLMSADNLSMVGSSGGEYDAYLVK
jgi:hypothetical protein